jgi:hypothetical protein
MLTNHKVIALALAAALFSGQAAAGGGVTGGATEPTQIMNNVLLGKSLSEQTAMVAQEIMTATNTLNTYQAALQDLTGLPSGVAQSMLAPLQGDLAAFYKLDQATAAARQANEQMFDLSIRRAAEWRAMAELGYDPKYFIAREVELAARSAEAQRQLEADMQAVQQNETRMKHLAKVMQDAPGSIKSTVSGLQTLQATAGLAAAEAAETNRLLVAARVEAAMQRDAAAKTKAVDSKAYADRLAKSKAANDARDADEQARIDRMKLPAITIGDTYSKPSKP